MSEKKTFVLTEDERAKVKARILVNFMLLSGTPVTDRDSGEQINVETVLNGKNFLCKHGNLARGVVTMINLMEGCIAEGQALAELKEFTDSKEGMQ